MGQLKKEADKPVTQKPGKGGIASLLSRISNQERLCLFLLLLLIVLVAGIKINFLNIPFERDEGAYSYYGKLLLEGKIPYIDFYEQKLPGLFYFYAFMVGVFGATLAGLHAGFIWLNVATIVLLYCGVRTMLTPIAGIIAAATFAFVALGPYVSGFTIQAEHVVAFFTSLGLLFYVLFHKRQKWYFCLLTGVSLGCAFLVKTNAIFFVLWGGTMLICDHFISRKKPLKYLFQVIGIYAGGVCLFLVVLSLVMVARGSFKEMIYWSYTFPKKYVSEMTLSDGELLFKHIFTLVMESYQAFWIHGFLAIAVCLVKQVSAHIKVFIVSLLLCSCLTIVPGLNFYGHYFIMVLPGLAFGAGVTFYGVISWLENGLKLKFKALKYIYLAAFCLLIVYHLSDAGNYYFNPDLDLVLKATYGINPFTETKEIADHLNSISKPGDKVVTIGSEPEIYVYTNEDCPSRHAYFTFLVWNVPEHRKWQREFASDVEKAKPRFFILYDNAYSLLPQPGTDSYVFNWAKIYVIQHYKLIGIVDMPPHQTSIYRWNNQTTGYVPVANSVIYIFERRDQT